MLSAEHLPRLKAISALAAAIACAACTSPPPLELAVGEQSLIRGWQHCSGQGCGRNFISAYSTLVILRVDDHEQYGKPMVPVTPGRHWIEAYYSWGFGILVGLGNWRNYGFELDFLPGHSYVIEDIPAGCLVPIFQYRANPVTLRIVDKAPSRERTVREIKAWEYCTPNSRKSGSCKRDSDCQSGQCAAFGGATVYGMCIERQP